MILSQTEGISRSQEARLSSQVAGQIDHIPRAIGEVLKSVFQDDYMIIDQEDVARCPRSALDLIFRPGNVDTLSEQEPCPNSFENRNVVKLDDIERTKPKQAIEEFFGDRTSADIILG
ncbi:MAG: hypothetical protein ACFFAZ_05410 [Promethearchaeota archaeon]